VEVNLRLAPAVRIKELQVGYFNDDQHIDRDIFSQELIQQISLYQRQDFPKIRGVMIRDRARYQWCMVSVQCACQGAGAARSREEEDLGEARWGACFQVWPAKEGSASRIGWRW
jgi:CO/xanthine dehydrogenase FAD-binding subunit